MALKDILAAIERQGSAEETRIAEEAEAEARSLVDRARSEAADIASKSRSRAEEVLAREIAQLRNSALRQAADIVGEAVQALSTAAFVEARERLASARDQPDYAQILASLVSEALDELPVVPGAQLLFDSRDAAAVGALAQASQQPLTTAATLTTIGGIRVWDARRLVSIDNTLESRLDRARELLGAELARLVLDSSEGRAAQRTLPPEVAHG